MIKIRVSMAFDYGTAHFTSGIHDIEDAVIVRYMVKAGYGEVLSSTVEEDKKTVTEEKPKTTRRRTTRKKKVEEK